MNKINANTQLSKAIIALEIKRQQQLIDIKSQFRDIYEGMKPSNLIKSAISEITGSSAVKSSISNTLIGSATGFIAKKLMVGSSLNPLKIGLGLLVQTLTTNVATKNGDKIKWAGGKLIELIASRIKRKRDDIDDLEPYK